MTETLKDRVRKEFIARFSGQVSGGRMERQEAKKALQQILLGIDGRWGGGISDPGKAKLVDELADEFTGLGPIENLMNDPSVTEIMINGPGNVYIERRGRKQLTDIKFDDNQQLMGLIRRIMEPTTRRVDESSPYVDISMKDGSRVNIIIPPLALDGPSVTIRKFLRELNRPADLVKMGTIDNRMMTFLEASIRAKANILFAGATGSGKTTMLGVLSSCIADGERIVTIEDTAELHLAQKHIVRLETRPPNIEGKGEISIRDLFKNSLRMRPGRIILGEIRGAEALDMLQAMCSGHRGALAAIHASTPADVIHRLEMMVLSSGIPMNLEAVHRQIASAVNLIVQLDQMSDGSRKATSVTQVRGIRDGQVILEDIFTYDIEKVHANGLTHGRFKATGVVPCFLNLFKKAGIDLPQDLFLPDPA